MAATRDETMAATTVELMADSMAFYSENMKVHVTAVYWALKKVVYWGRNLAESLAECLVEEMAGEKVAHSDMTKAGELVHMMVARLGIVKAAPWVVSTVVSTVAVWVMEMVERKEILLVEVKAV